MIRGPATGNEGIDRRAARRRSVRAVRHRFSGRPAHRAAAATLLYTALVSATVLVGAVGDTDRDDREAAAASRVPVMPDSAITRTPGAIDARRARIDGFHLSARQMHPIEDGFRPYQEGIVRPVPFGLVDDEGVRMFQLDDDPTVWNHPIAQLQYALRAIESHRLTGEVHYLDVARANAQRVADRAFEIDGAWYFPYDFTFDLHRNERGVLAPPWASGMASGQALSTFVRLHELTGDRRWRDYADRAFDAFLQAPDGRGFFSSWVDQDGLLWLEEYSRYPESTSERVLNGHMWSMFGLWDYWMMHDRRHADAEELWRGALYTVEQTAMSSFRRVGEVSRYSLWQEMPAYTYHQHHQRQFLLLWQMTLDPAWVERAFVYRADYPEWREAEGFAVVTPRVTAVHRLDDAAHHIQDRTMTIQETRSVSFTRVTGASYDRRGRMSDGTNVIRLSTGPNAGWWIPEAYGVAWSREPVERHDYHPAVELDVDGPRSVTVYRYEGDGTPSGHRTIVLQPGEIYAASASALVEGRAAWLLTGPDLGGWWLPDQSGVSIRATTGRTGTGTGLVDPHRERDN